LHPSALLIIISNLISEVAPHTKHIFEEAGSETSCIFKYSLHIVIPVLAIPHITNMIHGSVRKSSVGIEHRRHRVTLVRYISPYTTTLTNIQRSMIRGA